MEAGLEKLSRMHDERTREQEAKREKYYLGRRIAEKLKIVEVRLKMGLEFDKKDVKERK